MYDGGEEVEDDREVFPLRKLGFVAGGGGGRSSPAACAKSKGGVESVPALQEKP